MALELRGGGGAGLEGPRVWGRAQPGHEASFRPCPPPPALALHVQAVIWVGHAVGAPGEGRGPLGLFRWLSDHAPCVAGPTARRGAHTEPPRGSPLVGSDINPVSTAPGLWGLWSRTDLLGLRPAPHPQPTHWPTVLGSEGEAGPRCPASPPTPRSPRPPQKAWGAVGLASTSWSLWERPGGPGAQACGFEPPWGLSGWAPWWGRQWGLPHVGLPPGPRQSQRGSLSCPQAPAGCHPGTGRQDGESRP